jgi:hypothetical protein
MLAEGYAYMDEGYVDEDADVMGKLAKFFGFGKGKKEEELPTEQEETDK